MPERRVEIYLNVTPGSMFLDYQEGDEMRCAWRGTLVLPEDDREACHVVYAMFNVDPATDQSDLSIREASYTDRSLSMGDVVTLDVSQSYAVTTMEFKPVDLRTGHAIVGPEGDERIHELLNEDGAMSRVGAGIQRMADNLGEEVDRAKRSG
jgi:hypothetical protein